MFAENPGELKHPGYSTGLDAYDTWIKYLDGSFDYSKGHVVPGIAYNAEVWRECRKYAVDFLWEARLKVGQHDELFAEAIEHYTVVRDSLEAVARQYPFITRQPNHIEDPEKRKIAACYLATARDAEEKGLEALKRLVEVL